MGFFIDRLSGLLSCLPSSPTSLKIHTHDIPAAEPILSSITNIGPAKELMEPMKEFTVTIRCVMTCMIPRGKG